VPPTTPTAPTAPVYTPPVYGTPTYVPSQPTYSNDTVSIQNAFSQAQAMIAQLEQRIAQLETQVKTGAQPTAPVYMPQQTGVNLPWLQNSTVPTYNTGINGAVNQFAVQVQAIGNQLNQTIPQIVNTVQQLGQSFGNMFKSLGIKL
jgi:hypothetical protein